MCGQQVSFSLEHRHRVSVTRVMLRPYPKLLGPHRGGDQLPEEVVEDGSRGGGFGVSAVHGRGGIRKEAGLAFPALEEGPGD